MGNHLHSLIKMVWMTCLLGLSFAVFGQSQAVKLELTPSMVVNESGVGDPTLMVDEQSIAGDPGNDNGNHTSNKWFTPYNSSLYPAHAYIDLGTVTDLAQICLYDFNAMADLIVEYGEPGNWTYLFTEPCNHYKKWKNHFVNCSTRYVRFTKTSPNANFNEVVIYGMQAQGPIAAISDLAIDSVTENKTYLSWTDIDLGTTIGTPTAYDLRFSSQPITATNFETCSQFPLTVTPGAANSAKHIVVPNLESNKTYYFALRVLGDIPNSNPFLYDGASTSCTPISNIENETTLPSSTTGEYRLVLEPHMLTNVTGLGDAAVMVNEQLQTGDPATTSYQPAGEWFVGSNLSLYPLTAIIDLEEVKRLTKMYLFDINSMEDVVVEYGQPGNWHYLFTEDLRQYKRWKLHEFDVFTRYIRITQTHREAKFAEIVLYAYDDGQKPVEQKIELDASMVTNLSEYGDATALADEQTIAGDPANSTGGHPSVDWQTGFSWWIPYPCYAVIDLGRPVEITKVFLHDVNASGEFTIDFGNYFNWEPLLTDGLTGYLSWNQHNVSVITRYLRVGRSTPTSNANEIVIYGYDHFANAIDSIPPATITDLTIANADSASITLEWTAPGDDEWTGQALMYDMRYSHNPITPENFNDAIPMPMTVYPQAGGQQQSHVFDGLNSRTPYYFAIYTYDDFENKSALSNIASGETTIDIGGPIQKICLQKEMILNECVQGDATLLVDEQYESGDPMNNQGNTVYNGWDMGSGDWKYPGSAMIDLGANYLISDIYIFDDEDAATDTIAGPVSVYIGGPFDWTLAFEDSLLNSATWNAHIIDQQSRYIRITNQNIHTRFSEIVVYGSAQEALGAAPTATTHPAPLMDEFIGINAFINDPLGKLAAIGTIREYHNWMWIEGNNDQSYPGYPNNENAWYSSSTGFDFDLFYDNMDQMGIICSPAVQNNTVWNAGGDYSRLEHKPVDLTEDPLQPASYMEHADHFYQFAARYGSTQVASNLLKVASNNQALSGLNKIKYYENWNEQDKWWKGRGGFFLPYEYAAMSSADYDGHQGTLGTTVGLVNADPNAKFVMGGIAHPHIDYVRAMKLWSDHYRSGDFPWDVINIHHYSNNGGGQFTGTCGVSPEEDGLKERMEEFVEYRNKYLPGVEVWMSEFGYDTHPNSPQRAPEVGTFSQEEVQGQWLIRSYLAIAAAKIDKAMMYMLRDANSTSATQYNTSGLTHPASTGWAPKPSWYYVYTMKNQLAGMQFHSEIASGNALVKVYKFKNPANNQAVYFLWCPTSNQSSVNGFNLNLSQNESQAKLVELAVGHTNGIETTLTIDGGSVSVDVSERPVMVVVSDGTGFNNAAGAITQLVLDSTMIVDETGLGGVEILVDEQTTLGNPLMGDDLDADENWSTPGNTSGYPYSCYIDLGQNYDLSHIYLFDKYGSGNLEISAGSPGNWTPLFIDGCKRYNGWNPHVVNVNSRYIRITKLEPSANISEIMIYTKE